MSLQQQAVQQLVAVALKDPLAPGVPPQLNEVISEYIDKGFYISALATPLDSACEALPLEVSAMCRATMLARPEWDAEISEDSIPMAWDQMSVHLAASMAGASESSVGILEATSGLRDGGRFALAGVLNPAYDGLPVNALTWHPEIAYPPISSLVMLRDDSSADVVRRAGEPFVSGVEAQVWSVAPLQGPTALIPWPEWRAILSWVASEEPVGSLAYWTWLLVHINAGDLDEVVGTAGDWWDLDMWQQLVQERLGYLLNCPTEDVSLDPTEVEELMTALNVSPWPPAQQLQI